MNSHKRLFLITALAVLLFAAIAVGPAYKRLVTPVRAASPNSATVLLLCASAGKSGVLAPPFVETVELSAPSLTFSPPIFTGESCAVALESIFSEGFSRLDSTAAGNAFNDTDLSAPNVIGVYQWTLVRGH
ncbi:exported hypothetical protein [Candidatus Sulfopaludibacter sp. SbA4]|nr:exported hypothetical protein [Candidatus Sulfopaludibacter sp. SbA4]